MVSHPCHPAWWLFCGWSPLSPSLEVVWCLVTLVAQLGCCVVFGHPDHPAWRWCGVWSPLSPSLEVVWCLVILVIQLGCCVVFGHPSSPSLVAVLWWATLVTQPGCCVVLPVWQAVICIETCNFVSIDEYHLPHPSSRNNQFGSLIVPTHSHTLNPRRRKQDRQI